MQNMWEVGPSCTHLAIFFLVIMCLLAYDSGCLCLKQWCSVWKGGAFNEYQGDDFPSTAFQ